MDKLLSFLGLMLCSNNVSLGDSLINDIRKGKVYLVIVAKDMGETSKKKVMDKCKFYNVPLLEIYTKEELSRALGKNNLASLGIKQEKGAQKIINLNKEEKL